MTEHDLTTSLSALRPPPAPAEASGRALHRATLALRSSAALPTSTARPRRLRLLPVVASLAAACVALILALRPANEVAATPASEDIRLLAQLGEVFPGRINAVIISEGTAHIELSEDTPLIQPSDQAVVIELVRDRQHLRVLSYSGREVRLRISGADLAFSPLRTNDGNVLLAGSDFVWSSDAPGTVAGWTINARPLATL